MAKTTADRLTALEQRVAAITIEQTHMDSLMQTLVQAVEGLRKDLADPEQSPLGRQLLQAIDAVDRKVTENHGEHVTQLAKVDQLKTSMDELKGMLTFARASGVAGVLLSMAAIVVATVAALLKSVLTLSGAK